jgi:hypothetical protein
MPWDKLSFELVTSPPKKKYKYHYRVLIVGLEDEEKKTHLEEMDGGDDEELQVTTT